MVCGFDPSARQSGFSSVVAAFFGAGDNIRCIILLFRSFFVLFWEYTLEVMAAEFVTGGMLKKLQGTTKMPKTTRQKKLSAATVVCLGILSDYPDGMSLDDAVAGYEQMNLECERRAVCTYLHRVKKLGFIVTKGANANTTYHMTKAGERELAWWRVLVG